MIDRAIVATRLSKLRESMRKLCDIAAKSHDEYMSSDVDRALAEHYLRLALEVTLDIGSHVIAAAGFRKPLQLREIPLILAENNIITKELSEKLAHSAGLRNRLIHAYLDIDHEILYEVLQRDLDDLDNFAIAIGQFCGKTE